MTFISKMTRLANDLLSNQGKFKSNLLKIEVINKTFTFINKNRSPCPLYPLSNEGGDVKGGNVEVEDKYNMGMRNTRGITKITHFFLSSPPVPKK